MSATGSVDAQTAAAINRLSCGEEHAALPTSTPPQLSITDPSITIVSPSTGTWYVGNTLLVQWTGSVSGVDTLDINLWPEEGGKIPLYTITTGIPASSGSYSWTIPNGALQNYGGVSHKFYIQLVGKAFEVKSSLFSIVSSTSTQPSLTVTSPNGGEAWKVGETQLIRWGSSGIAANYNVQIGIIDTRYNTEVGPRGEAIIAYSIPNTGSYSWTIPQSVGTMDLRDTGQSVYKIVVHSWADSVTGSAIGDSSNAPFSIVSSQPQTGTVNVVTRHGGRVIEANENGSCVSSLVTPSGSNTASCVRTITNTAVGTYSLQWYGGYPAVSGIDTNKAPTITPAQTLTGGSSITFYLDFEYVPPPVTKTYTAIDRPTYGTTPICGDATSIDRFCKDNGYEGGELGTAYSGGSCVKWEGTWISSSATLYTAKCYRTSVGVSPTIQPALYSSFIQSVQIQLNDITSNLLKLLENLR